MQQSKTPLFDALHEHARKRPFSMHVPGHKNGHVLSTRGLLYFKEILKIDATELTGLDDLHHPEGAILEAEELTASLYGVDKSYFLVNGSTVGNLSMILAVCSPNDTILVQRNSHKSIINGLKLAGAKPVFLHPEYDEEVQVPSYVSFDTVKEALDNYPDAKAIILTNPTYYGMSNPSELGRIISFAHAKNIPVLIDEAHGAHFILDGFPDSALSLGADIVVHSAHKTLPAMTMGSFLHINSKLVNPYQVANNLQVLQSSSPSYPIMASLDLARHYLAGYKNSGTTSILEKIKGFKASLKELSQIKIVESSTQFVQTDPLKLTIQSHCQFNGFQLQSLFEKEGIYSELADPNNVLFVLPLSEGFEYRELLRKIRNVLKDTHTIKKNFRNLTHDMGKITALPIFYNEIKGYNKKVVSFNEAVGNISGEMIVPYPPGIPLLMEGEIITERHIELISTYLTTGARFQGGDMRGRNITILES
ncbi:aminotransferase class I/II-fold pyridoxal phosphate-dependent enzyme [Fredinandcohnia humi]